MKKTTIAFIITLFAAISMTSQTKFDLPQNIELKTDSDYAKYENDISSAAKWLEETDLNQETEKRKQIDTFIIKWVSGTPNVTVEMNQSLMKLYATIMNYWFYIWQAIQRILLKTKMQIKLQRLKLE